MNTKISLLLLSMTLSSCAITVPAPSKDDLRSSATRKYTNITLSKSYIALGECWEKLAEKPVIDFKNAAHIEYLIKQQRIEIYHAWTAPFKDQLLYGSIIYLTPLMENKTLVNGFGVGNSGDVVLSQWMSTLENCANS